MENNLFEMAFFHGDYSMLPSIAELELSKNSDPRVAHVTNEEILDLNR